MVCIVADMREVIRAPVLVVKLGVLRSTWVTGFWLSCPESQTQDVSRTEQLCLGPSVDSVRSESDVGDLSSIASYASILPSDKEHNNVVQAK